MKKLICLLFNHKWVHLNPEPPAGATLEESMRLMQAWITAPPVFWCSRCHRKEGGW